MELHSRQTTPPTDIIPAIESGTLRDSESDWEIIGSKPLDKPPLEDELYKNSIEFVNENPTADFEI
jgi:hypothetical protein